MLRNCATTFCALASDRTAATCNRILPARGDGCGLGAGFTAAVRTRGCGAAFAGAADGCVAELHPCVTAGADFAVDGGLQGCGGRAVDDVAICVPLLPADGVDAVFDENALLKNDPTFDTPWLIDEPIFDSVVPTPVSVCAVCFDVLSPRGMADNVVDGGAVAVTEGASPVAGVVGTAAGCVRGAGAVGLALGVAVGCCLAVAAVVVQADVAVPVGALAVIGTGFAGAVLDTPAPGCNPVGTLVPKPASL